MAHRLLAIESEPELGARIQEYAAARSLDVRLTSDGTEGLQIARDWRPDVIVLCVELNRISGYSICNKLKKDGTLRTIPLILTSSQATEETFAQHQKLKTRADAYLHKPYTLEVLFESVQGFLGILPAASSEQAISLGARPTAEPARIATGELEPIGDPRPGANLPDAFGRSTEVPLQPAAPAEPEPRMTEGPISEVRDISASDGMWEALDSIDRAPADDDVDQSFNALQTPSTAASSPVEPEMVPRSVSPPPLRQAYTGGREASSDGQAQPIPRRSVSKADGGQPAPTHKAPAGALQTEVLHLQRKVRELEDALRQKDADFAARLVAETNRAEGNDVFERRVQDLETALERERQRCAELRVENKKCLSEIESYRTELQRHESVAQNHSEEHSRLEQSLQAQRKDEAQWRQQAQVAEEYIQREKQKVASMLQTQKKLKDVIEQTMGDIGQALSG